MHELSNVSFIGSCGADTRARQELPDYCWLRSHLTHTAVKD